VAALVAVDACAEYVLADAEWLVPVPDDVDPAAATVLPMLAPIAAGLVRFGRVAAGETVLVHTAAGALGHLAVQLARRAGARVIGSTGSPDKADAVRGFGAEAVVHTSDDGWPDRVRELAPGGVDVILDALGGSAIEANLGLLAPYGRQVVYGALDRQIPSVSAQALFGLKSLSALSSAAWWAARPDEVRAEMANVTALLRSGELRVEVAAVLPLEEIAEAHRLLEDRSRIGRVVLAAK
jgi:NADPH2:quinone reductase